MARQTPVSAEARQRLREHQSTAKKVVVVYTSALHRLDLARDRRAKVVTEQDAVVTGATNRVEEAIASAAGVLGAEVAASVLGLSTTEVRRVAKKAKQQ
jgi:hypothetical protein